jgi:hypothetical protein
MPPCKGIDTLSQSRGERRIQCIIPCFTLQASCLMPSANTARADGNLVPARIVQGTNEGWVRIGALIDNELIRLGTQLEVWSYTEVCLGEHSSCRCLCVCSEGYVALCAFNTTEGIRDDISSPRIICGKDTLTCSKICEEQDTESVSPYLCVKANNHAVASIEWCAGWR